MLVVTIATDTIGTNFPNDAVIPFFFKDTAPIWQVASARGKGAQTGSAFAHAPLGGEELRQDGPATITKNAANHLGAMVETWITGDAV